jgi:hypothetical protein
MPINEYERIGIVTDSRNRAKWCKGVHTRGIIAICALDL